MLKLQQGKQTNSHENSLSVTDLQVNSLNTAAENSATFSGLWNGNETPTDLC